MCILDPLQEGQEDTFSPTEFWSDDEELMFWEESQSTCLKSLPSPQPDREAFVADSVQDDTFSQTKFLSQDEELMFFEESSFLKSLPWLQADSVEFVADSDQSDSEQSDVPVVHQESFANNNFSSGLTSSASWGPIRRERWRQWELKKQEKFITFRDWLLTGTYVHSNVMIDAGLYGIDVSQWKDDDFECLKPDLSISQPVAPVVGRTISPVVDSCTSKFVQLSLTQVVASEVAELDVSHWKDEDFEYVNPEPSTSQPVAPVVESCTSKFVELSLSQVAAATVAEVDVSSWTDDDFKIPARPFRERKDAKGKIKKSTNVQPKK